MESQINPEVLDIVNLISDKKRSEALDKVTDYLYAKASEVIDAHKKTVASNFFDDDQTQVEEQ